MNDFLNFFSQPKVDHVESYRSVNDEHVQSCQAWSKSSEIWHLIREFLYKVLRKVALGPMEGD